MSTTINHNCRVLALLTATTLAVAAPSYARVISNEPAVERATSLVGVLPVLGIGVTPQMNYEVTRNGADDPAGHDRGGNRNRGGKGRGGHDDGPAHT